MEKYCSFTGDTGCLHVFSCYFNCPSLIHYPKGTLGCNEHISKYVFMEEMVVEK